MHNLTFETKPYCEWLMADAIKEYDETQNISAFAIATKYGLPVQDIHVEYAKYKAIGGRCETMDTNHSNGCATP